MKSTGAGSGSDGENTAADSELENTASSTSWESPSFSDNDEDDLQSGFSYLGFSALLAADSKDQSEDEPLDSFDDTHVLKKSAEDPLPSAAEDEAVGTETLPVAIVPAESGLADPEPEPAPEPVVEPGPFVLPNFALPVAYEPVAPSFAPPSFAAPVEPPVVPSIPEQAEPSFTEPVAPSVAEPENVELENTAPEPVDPAPAPQDPLPEIPAVPSWPTTATKPRRKRSKGLAIAIVAVAVLLAFGGGYALHAVMTPASSEGMGMQHSVEAAPKTVETYLEALADGDAATARKIVGADSSEPLLSDEVVKRSNELAPISNISVGDGVAKGKEVEVTAKFTVSENSVERTFRLWNTSAGWQLADGLVPVSFASLSGLGVTLNGATPKVAEARVFPGMYEFSLSQEAFEVDTGSGPLLIATPEDAANVIALQPSLTPEASTRFTEMVRASLDECLAMKDLVTPCGLDVSAKLNDGATPIEGTVRRTLDDDGKAALDAMVVQLDGEAAGTVFSVLNAQVKTHLEAENNGSRVSGELLYGGQLLSPYVDFTAETPVVTWK